MSRGFFRTVLAFRVRTAEDSSSRPRFRDRFILYLLIVLPFAALLAAVPVVWGWGLGWPDVVIAVAFYSFTTLGANMGFHRYFTHRAFKAGPLLHKVLAIAGSMALQGPPIAWVADHRKHHRYADEPGDPHSPWRYGTSVPAVARGMLFAHVGWMFRERASFFRYAPDLVRDPVVLRISRKYWHLVGLSVLLPALLGGAATWSWQGAATAFFWGSLVRIALVHHVAWSVKSICHVAGSHPFQARDRSGNVWWLALPSFGESWHNLHHAHPTSARHGVLPGQIDLTARAIRACERLGWAWDVRWHDTERPHATQPLTSADTAAPGPTS